MHEYAVLLLPTECFEKRLHSMSKQEYFQRTVEIIPSDNSNIPESGGEFQNPHENLGPSNHPSKPTFCSSAKPPKTKRHSPIKEDPPFSSQFSS